MDADVATAAIVVGGLPLPLPLLPSVTSSDGVAGRASDGSPAPALGLARQLTEGVEIEAVAAASVCGDPGTLLLLLLARCWRLGRRDADEEERRRVWEAVGVAMTPPPPPPVVALRLPWLGAVRSPLLT